MSTRLQEIFEEANQDTYALSINAYGYKSRMVYGIKIVRDNDTGDIQFLNTMMGGDYYIKLSEDQINVFIQNGWRYGVYVLSLSNYRIKLDIIEKRMQKYISEKKSEKQVKQLKSSRERVLAKYSEINFKLNQLNYGGKNVNTNKKEADNF